MCLHWLHICMLIQMDWILFCLFSPPLEDRQKKKRQQKKKHSAEGKTSLQRSKTFVNLLFRKDRKEKSCSKSPSHHADKGEDSLFFPAQHKLILTYEERWSMLLKQSQRSLWAQFHSGTYDYLYKRLHSLIPVKSKCFVMCFRWNWRLSSFHVLFLNCMLIKQLNFLSFLFDELFRMDDY